VKRLLLQGLGRALRPARRRFLETLDDPAAAQARVLRRLTAHLCKSDYGRHLGVRTPDDFAALVPVVDYETLQPWLDRQRAREGAVLTDERVLFYEKTSGSSGAAKYIPYTASLRRSFSRMFAVWAADLLAIGPPFQSGKLYMSVSPSFAHEPPAERGVAVGMTDDREYLDGWLRRMVSPFVVYDAEAARARDVETFKRRTAELLVGSRDLEIMSVWSPSFLKVLLDEITERYGTDDWRALWPRLKLISCWASASAAPQARALARLMPGVMIQGKGLLATEAPITVPLIAARAPMPLVDEVLIELEDDAGQLVPVYEGVVGREYGVVVSQSGGLYRYRLHDRVMVAPHYRGTPGLEFVGRTGGISDLCGEKLNERFVAAALDGLAPAAFVKTLVPVREPRDHYVLIVDRLDGDPRALAATLDARLRRAHHYHHARELGQLGEPRVRVAANAAALVTAADVGRGMKLGDIKPRALHTGRLFA
jgi:hypothetical protein